MYVNSHGATPQYPSKSSFTYKNTKYDLYNDLIGKNNERYKITTVVVSTVICCFSKLVLQTMVWK